MNQQGGVASFLMVGLVLVVATGGLLYWVSRSGSESVMTPEITLKEHSETDESQDKDKSKPSSTRPDDSSAEGSSADKDDATGVNVSDNKAAQTSGTSVGEFSETGPTETFAQLLAVGALALSIVGFIRSHAALYEL